MNDLAYVNVGEELKERILELIPTHPEIMQIESAWDLFQVEGFKCDDLGPSLFQASWALRAAQHHWAKGNHA